MFLGKYQHSLDVKGRVTIPSKLRDQLGERFIATRGLDNCIFLYSLDEWRTIEDKLRTLPGTRADVRAFMRKFLSAASELELDKQGRTVLPSNLREYADIFEDIIIIGVHTRVEIWSCDKWDAYDEGTDATYETVAESLDLGI